MADKHFIVQYDIIAASVGRFGWKVLLNKGPKKGRAIANCETKDDAMTVEHALNFNAKPSDYGYKLVD